MHYSFFRTRVVVATGVVGAIRRKRNRGSQASRRHRSSYGGFMTYWLITQDSRFAAAAAVAPVSNHLTVRERGVESVLVTYPEEGHGVRKFPTAIDSTARIAGFFMKHMPAAL